MLDKPLPAPPIRHERKAAPVTHRKHEPREMPKVSTRREYVINADGLPATRYITTVEHLGIIE